MIKITWIWLFERVLRGYNGISIFIFIFFKDKSPSLKLVNHETIHFFQQVELLFIGHWILYFVFYIINYIKFSKRENASEFAYRLNPFELEAYDNEDNLHYLLERKPYSWIKYI